MSKKLSDFAVLTFDCYGTLIDWESGIWDALQPLIHSNGRDDITRSMALAAFAEAEGAQQEATPTMLYPDILQQVHVSMAKRFELQTKADMDHAFGTSVPHWPAFPDSADALRLLKKHFKLVILSNVNRDGFAASNRKLGVAFDAIYTAQDVGSYKPNPDNFKYLLEHLDKDLGLMQDAVLHTAQSLFHDHLPASKAGLTRAWIDRQGLSKGGDWGATARVEGLSDPDFLFPTMMAMADAVVAES